MLSDGSFPKELQMYVIYTQVKLERLFSVSPECSLCEALSSLYPSNLGFQGLLNSDFAD